MVKQNLYLKNGTLFATGYNRIVHGERGDYVEFERDQIVPKHYWWLIPETDPETKVYFQKKTVKYADYKIGKYYVDPYLLKDFKDPEQLFNYE